MTRDDGFSAGAGGAGRAAVVLPIVRAALAAGEGPPAVVAWVGRQVGARRPGPDWTAADEARARVLAARLADRLDAHDRAAADTGGPWDTLGSPPT